MRIVRLAIKIDSEAIKEMILDKVERLRNDFPRLKDFEDRHENVGAREALLQLYSDIRQKELK